MEWPGHRELLYMVLKASDAAIYHAAERGVIGASAGGERCLLQDLHNLTARHPDAQLVTFDGEVFEWQVVMTRAMVHGLPTPAAIVRAVGGRESHVDLRTIFKKDAPSLERLAAILVVPDDNGLLTLNSPAVIDRAVKRQIQAKAFTSL